jgi:hypothetical protein
MEHGEFTVAFAAPAAEPRFVLIVPFNYAASSGAGASPRALRGHKQFRKLARGR